MSGALPFSANPVTQIIEDKLREQLKAVKRTSMGRSTWLFMQAETR